MATKAGVEKEGNRGYQDQFRVYCLGKVLFICSITLDHKFKLKAKIIG